MHCAFNSIDVIFRDSAILILQLLKDSEAKYQINKLYYSAFCQIVELALTTMVPWIAINSHEEIFKI